MSSLFNEEYAVVVGTQGTGNNLVRGFNHWNGDLGDRALESIRREVEMVDRLDGVQVGMAIGGGTGAGLGTFLIDEIVSSRDQVCGNNTVEVLALVPSGKTGGNYETYCALHSVHKFSQLDNSFIVVVDNAALEYVLTKRMQLRNHTYDDFNHLSAYVLSTSTACMRFPGQLNINLRKLQLCLTPDKTIKLIVPSIAPLHSKRDRHYININSKELFGAMLSPRSRLVTIPEGGTYLGLVGIIRGRANVDDIETCMQRTLSAKENHFHSFKVSHSGQAYILSGVLKITLFYNLPSFANSKINILSKQNQFYILMYFGIITK